jgi:hypothetical protein
MRRRGQGTDSKLGIRNEELGMTPDHPSKFGIRNSEFPTTLPRRFRISDFGFSIRPQRRNSRFSALNFEFPTLLPDLERRK